MSITFYQEYDTRDKKVERSLVFIVDKKSAYYVDKTQVINLWLSTANKLIEDKTLREITQEAAFKAVPELEAFLEKLPTLPPLFIGQTLTHGG